MKEPPDPGGSFGLFSSFGASTLFIYSSGINFFFPCPAQFSLHNLRQSIACLATSSATVSNCDPILLVWTTVVTCIQSSSNMDLCYRPQVSSLVLFYLLHFGISVRQRYCFRFIPLLNSFGNFGIFSKVVIQTTEKVICLVLYLSRYRLPTTIGNSTMKLLERMLLVFIAIFISDSYIRKKKKKNLSDSIF